MDDPIYSLPPGAGEDARQSHRMSSAVPFYRNVRVLAVLAQVVCALAVVGIGWWLMTTKIGRASCRERVYVLV